MKSTRCQLFPLRCFLIQPIKRGLALLDRFIARLIATTAELETHDFFGRFLELFDPPLPILRINFNHSAAR